MAAPTAEACTFNRKTAFPGTAVTVSFSRIARSTRPKGERATRWSAH